MIEYAVRARRRIKALIQILLNREPQGRLRDWLVQGIAWSFALKIAATGFAFITSIILARTLGSEGYGIYAYAMALVGLLGVPATVGLPQLVLRNVAAYQAGSEWGLMHGLLHWANKAVLCTVLGIGVTALLVSLMLRDYFNPTMLAAFLLALLILPLRALNALRSSTLRGLGYVLLGQLPDSLIRPFSFLVIVVATYLALSNGFDASWAVGVHVGATAIALGSGTVMLARHVPKAIRKSCAAYDSMTWVRSSLPFVFIAGMQVINDQTDIVMLGALRGAEVVGIYRAVTRGAQLVVFVLAAAGMVLQPTIAKVYAVRDMQRLQRIATQSARVALLVSLPIAIVVIVFGRWILLIFGQEFTNGATALAILGFGQIFNTAMGSVGLLLNMTGHERDTAAGIGIAAVINVVLNAILIPLHGMEGAATATATSLVVWNVVLAVKVTKRIHIYPTVFGQIGLRKKL